METSGAHRILISPIGEFEPALIQAIGDQIFRIFGFPSETASVLDELSFAYNAERNQYHSTPILDRLETLSPKGYLKVLALTHVDLYIPILTHVFGEAQLGGKACIVSTCRLNEDNYAIEAEKIFKNRLMKESVHEIGHTFNLRHCKNNDCIMNYCRSVREVDMRQEFLCRYCRVLLEDEKKVHNCADTKRPYDHGRG